MSEATAALVGDNGSADAGTATSGAAPASNDNAWNSGFDEDTLAYIGNKGWKGPSDIVSSYRNLEKFSGGSKNLVELPGADADADAMSAFYNKLGRPESADKYSFELPDAGDEELFSWFRQTAHETGLTDTQAAQLFQRWEQLSSERIEGIQQQAVQSAEADIASLKKEWGQGFDSQIASGRRAVEALGLDEGKLSEYEGKLGTAEMLKLFAALGSKMGEDSFEDGGRSNSGFGMTPAAARAQLEDLRMDSNFMDKYLSGDKDALSKMQRLMEMAHG